MLVINEERNFTAWLKLDTEPIPYYIGNKAVGCTKLFYVPGIHHSIESCKRELQENQEREIVVERFYHN